MTTSFQTFNQGGQFQAAQVDLGSNNLEQLNQQRVQELDRQSNAILQRDRQAAQEVAEGAKGLEKRQDGVQLVGHGNVTPYAGPALGENGVGLQLAVE